MDIRELRECVCSLGVSSGSLGPLKPSFVQLLLVQLSNLVVLLVSIHKGLLHFLQTEEIKVRSLCKYYNVACVCAYIGGHLRSLHTTKDHIKKIGQM